MLSLSKGEAFAKISSVVALQARSDKRKSESLGGKSNRAEVKGEAFAKISSVVALQARSDKRKSESLGGKFMLSPSKYLC